jgi:ribonuclease P protein component
MEPARIGYSVPRSTGGAVVRNRVRRRLREALRPRLPELTGLDLVVSVSAEAARAPWPVLVAGVDRGIEAARRRLAGRGR